MQEPRFKGITRRKSEGGKSLAEQFGSLKKDDLKKPRKTSKKEKVYVAKKGAKGVVVKR